MVGLATRQRDTYFKQAESLAKKFADLSKLEDRMATEGKVIVKGLRDQQMKFDEYERAMVDKTLTAALAAVYLGAGDNRPKQKMEASWASIVGNMLPPLKTFLDETKIYLDNGILKYNDDSLDFIEDEYETMDALGYYQDPEELIEQGQTEAEQDRSIGKTWPAVYGRVNRYLSTPLYSFYYLGDYYNKQEQGYKEMRRVPRVDRRTCPDCVSFGEQGWKPMGSLPLPGKDCRCWDRCRCRIEYR